MMFHRLAILWDVISYPLYIISVIAFILLLIYSVKYSKNMKDEDIEDDPSGNDNVKKKFYKYM